MTITQSSTALLLVAGSLVGSFPHPIYLILVFVIIFCFGLIAPNGTGRALEPFSKNAGSASALLGCMQMGAGAGTSALVSHFHNGTALPMAVVMTSCAIVSLVMSVSDAVIDRRGSLRRRSHVTPEQTG
jgi:DHA1 family bicyclomycin/chloramphenicol resistance-like MFS transporter